MQTSAKNRLHIQAHEALQEGVGIYRAAPDKIVQRKVRKENGRLRAISLGRFSSSQRRVTSEITVFCDFVPSLVSSPMICHPRCSKLVDLPGEIRSRPAGCSRRCNHGCQPRHEPGSRVWRRRRESRSVAQTFLDRPDRPRANRTRP